MAKINIFRENDDIIFEPELNMSLSDKQENFVLDVEKTVIVLSELYLRENKEMFEKYFVQVLNLSQIGLADRNAHLDLSKNSLKQLQNEIVRIESSNIKNKHLIELGTTTFKYYVLPSFLLFTILYFFQYSKYKYEYNFDASQWKNVFLVVSSSSCGLWISTTISKMKLEFSDLITIESNEMLPHLRLIFTNIMSLIFLVLFLKQVFVIKLGPISSVDILNDSIISIAFGVFLGLNERILGNSLLKKTSGLIK